MLNRKRAGGHAIIGLFALVLMAFGCLKADAQTWQNGDFYYSMDASNNAYISGYTGAGGTVTIPIMVTNVPSFYSRTGYATVTAIGEEAFYKCATLTNVLLPGSIASIGTSAFESCSNLVAIAMLDNVASVGDRAFKSCVRLTNAAFGAGLTTIGALTFADCAKLNSVVFPGNLSAIGTFAFAGCSNLAGAYFTGNAPSSFGSLVFSNTAAGFTIYYKSSATGWSSPTWNGYPAQSFDATGAVKVTISYLSGSGTGGRWQVDGGDWQSSGATVGGLSVGNHTISFSAVSGFKTPTSKSVVITSNATNAISSGYISGGLQFTGASDAVAITGFTASSNTLTIPSTLPGVGTVVSIGDNAFYGNTNLKSVTLPESLTNIGYSAFAGSGLKDILVPNSVVSLGWGVFSDCGGLTNAVIGNGAAAIPGYAFENCHRLAAVTLGGGIANINDHAFRNCSGLRSISIPNSVTNIGNSAFEQCSSLAALSIPDSVTQIGEGAFYACGLTNAVISETVASIGPGAFGSCAQLLAIEVDPNNPAYSSRNGVLFDKTQTRLLGYPAGLGGPCAIPAGVSAVATNAFSSCRTISAIVLPASVTNIESSAFFGCSQLTGAYFLGNAPVSFGSLAFFSCASDFTIYYPPDASGWSAPTWNGYPAQPWSSLPDGLRPSVRIFQDVAGAKPAFDGLLAGLRYQMQISTNLIDWSNVGDLFTATNAIGPLSQPFNPTNSQHLFFRLQMEP